MSYSAIGSRGLDPGAEHLGNAPGLGDAAPGREGRFGVEDFADRAQRGLVQMWAEGFEKVPGAPAVIGMDLEPGVDERADQPGPDRALVVGRVPGPQVSEIARLVVRLAGRQRPQADRGQKPLGGQLQHRLPPACGRAPHASVKKRTAGWDGRRDRHRCSPSTTS